MTTYASVLLACTKRIHSVLDVRQRMFQFFHTFGIRWLNRQGVTAALGFQSCVVWQPFLMVSMATATQTRHLNMFVYAYLAVFDQF